MEEVEIEFLKESNAIEREYSEEALEDAIISWEYAKKLKFGQPYNKSIKEILGIHKRLMKRLNPRIAGKIRKVQVGVMTRDGFKPAIDYKEIMNELKELLNVALYPYYPGEQYIREWHIQFEKIHPFEDGNGRTGRILMNIQRLKMGLPLLIIHEGKEQQEYYKWFKDSYKKSVEDVKLL